MLNFDNMIITKGDGFSKHLIKNAKVEVVNISRSKSNRLLEEHPNDFVKENEIVYYYKEFNSNKIVDKKTVSNYLAKRFEEDYKNKYSKTLKKKRKIDNKKLIMLGKVNFVVLIIALNVLIGKVFFSNDFYDDKTTTIRYGSFIIAGLASILIILMNVAV